MKITYPSVLLLVITLMLSPFSSLYTKDLERGDLSIESFLPPTGIFYPGDEVTSTLEIKNRSTERQVFYVGYSLQDGAKTWYDVPAEEVTLEAGETTYRSLTWIVPPYLTLTSGPYLTVMALWDKIPHEEGAHMLARVEAERSFSVYNVFEDFSTFNGQRWKRDSHQLGYSRLHPRNVVVEDSMLQIIIPANTLNGGGIATRRLLEYGSYEARMKLPEAPSSITGFFLYRDPDFYHEIDIEIYNDPKGEVFFTTYAAGERTHTSTHSLGFDPTIGFHNYRFDYYPSGVTFYVDDVKMASWSEGLTDTPMYLMLNTWFPKWLAGIPQEEEVRTLVDWIRY